MEWKARRAYFVLGLENSGNRMLVQALTHAGCWGNPHLGQLWDEPSPTFDWIPGNPDLIAFPRSVRHGGVIPQPFLYAERMQQASYQVIPVHLYRKSDFAVAGHLKANYADSVAVARERIDLTATLAHELGARLQTPVMTVIYEQFVLNKEYRDALFAQFGLPPTTYELFNANEGYQLDHPPYSF